MLTEYFFFTNHHFSLVIRKAKACAVVITNNPSGCFQRHYGTGSPFPAINFCCHRPSTFCCGYTVWIYFLYTSSKLLCIVLCLVLCTATAGRKYCCHN